MNRRLTLYRKLNPIDDLAQHITQFFKDYPVNIQKWSFDEVAAEINRINE